MLACTAAPCPAHRSRAVRSCGVAALCMLIVTIVTVPVCAQLRHDEWGQAPTIEKCDYCLASQGISPLEVGASGLRIDFRYLRLGTMFDGGRKVENTDRELETHFTQQFSAFHALSARWSVAAFIPVARRYTEFVDEDGNAVTGRSFGLGDISFLVRYKPVVQHSMDATSIVSVALGIKLPTGGVNGRDSKGNLLDPHIQLGSGSTDLLVGTGGVMAFDRIAVIANVLAAFTGTGAHAHRFGNMLNYDGTLRYRIYPGDYADTQLFLTAGLGGEWRGSERENGADLPATSGNVLFFVPGMQLFITPALAVEASLQLPIVHALAGEQLGEDYRILAGIMVQP